MLMRRSWMVIAFLAACADTSDPDPSTFRITDQSGGVFLWTADERVHRIAGVSPEFVPCFEGEVSGYIAVGHRFVAVLGLCSDPATNLSRPRSIWSRFVVCESDEDCPQIDRFDKAFECRVGFCQNVDLEAYPKGIPDHSDMLGLCTGDEPRPAEAAAEPSPMDIAVAAACPSEYASDVPCDYIPDGCPDPG